MDRFHIIDDSIVHLRSRGVYREAPAYRRGSDVFAKTGGGFIKLLGSSGTTVSSISWDAIEAAGVTQKSPGSSPKFSET